MCIRDRLYKGATSDREEIKEWTEAPAYFSKKWWSRPLLGIVPGVNIVLARSSNISRSALTSGIEWNYRFNSRTDQKNYDKFFHSFEDLFENHSIVIDDEELRKYSKNWHRPAVSKDLQRYDEEQDDHAPDQDADANSNIIPLFEPRGAQIEALCALDDTRAEGAERALVAAATGVGKTYLAAFDSKDYARVLFVAHREEILEQAAISFKNVRHSEDYGFFNGKEKSTDKALIFASVATLGRTSYLNEKYLDVYKRQDPGCCSKADCRRHSERNPAGQPGRSKADCCRCEI